MASFFIDTDTGQVATQNQLLAAGYVAPTDVAPPRPWLRIQGTGDATTMWYAVLRKGVKDKFIGTLVFRHSPHHASLLADGWEEIPVDEIAAPEGRPPDELLAVDAALDRLAAADPAAAELVKLRYFAGLSIPQAAEVLGVSPRTADRLWTYARAWLRREIGPE